MMLGKLGAVDAIIKSLKPPPQDSFSTDQEGPWGWFWVGRFSSGSLTEPICTVRLILNTFACNLLITQLGSNVQNSFEIGSCQSNMPCSPIVASCDLHALSTIQKRNWREGNWVRKMPYLQTVRVSAIFGVIDKRQKRKGKRRFRSCAVIWTRRTSASALCATQKLFRVVGSSHSFWQVRLISRNSSQRNKGWLNFLLIII